MKTTNILSFIEKRTHELENHVALGIRSNLGWNEITFKGLSTLAKRLAGYLIDIGIDKGDKVAILSESTPELGATLFANVLAGAISVPLDVKLTIHELTHILSDCTPKAIMTSSAHLADAIKLKEIIPSLEHIVILDGRGANSDYINLHTLPDLPDKKWRHRGINKTALIVYTSGTTGKPKGVETSFKNVYSQVQAVGKCFNFTKDDSMLSILPMNHLFEITVGYMTFLNKGASIYYSNSLKPKDIFTVMQEKKITFMVGVPAFIKLVKSTIESEIRNYSKFKKLWFEIKYNFAKLANNHLVSKMLFTEIRRNFGPKFKGFMSGGAPLDMEVAEFFKTIGIKIYEVYGLTETSPIITINHDGAYKLGSVGRPLDGVKVRLDKHTSELQVVGDNVMNGYYNQPELTKETFTADGWLKTGDIAKIDSHGFVYITGRIKNMIVLSGGKKVFPEEVEAVMIQSPMIEEIVVYSDLVKEGSKKGTEEIVAKIYPTRDVLEKYPTDKELEAAIRKEVKKYSLELSSYKRPNNVVITRSPLPRTGISKVSRKQAKQA